MEMKDFGISVKINKWCVLLSVILPTFVIVCFSFISEVKITNYNNAELLITLFVALISALKAGITEEMLFRGFIMRLVEKRWNRVIAIVIPSLVIHSDSPLITGEGFGIEASIIAIIGYALVCIGIKCAPKCKKGKVNTTDNKMNV